MKLYRLFYLVAIIIPTLAFSQNVDSLTIVFRKTTDKSQKSLILTTISEYYQQIRIDTALNLAKEALTIATNEKFKKGILKASFQIGTLYQKQGNDKDALLYYQQAFVYAEQLKDTLMIARVYYQLGILNEHAGNIKKAEEYFGKSLAIFKKLGKTNLEANNLNTLGFIYNKQDNPDTAIVFYKQGLDIATKIKDFKVISLISGNLGDIYRKRNKYDSAITFYNDENRYATLIKSNFLILNSWKDLANIYFEKGNYNKSSLFLTKIFNSPSSDDIAIHEIIAESYWIQSEIYRETNKMVEALKYRDLSRKLADSVSHKRQSATLLILQNADEIERKQDEIELLKIEKTEQKWLGIFLLAGLGFFLLVVLSISFVLYRRSLDLDIIKAQNQKLKEQNEEIQSQSEMLQEAYEEISQLNNVLDEKVKVRTLALNLQNKKLREYLFINSHKLRAPIARILGMAEVFKMVNKEDIDDEMLKHLSLSAEELDNIVHEVQEMLTNAYFEEPEA